MNLPFFYAPLLSLADKELFLDEPTSKHIIQVLRMQPADKLLLTNGKGIKASAIIRIPDKKRCIVSVREPIQGNRGGPEVHIAISPLKNAHRFEWFLEKATEIGVSGIIPLQCERSERNSLREERMMSILVSAMIQSRQSWLPSLKEPTPFSTFVSGQKDGSGHHYIAHCIEGQKASLTANKHVDRPATILIGPEGDFSSAEVALAISMNWLPVTLGDTRLRTETAGVVAATLLRLA